MLRTAILVAVSLTLPCLGSAMEPGTNLGPYEITG